MVGGGGREVLGTRTLFARPSGSTMRALSPTSRSMSKFQAPVFGMVSQIRHPKDPSTFADYGFLSGEAEATRWSASAEKRNHLDSVKASVQSIHRDFDLLFADPLQGSDWPALAFLDRTLEACQAAALLADKGMVSSACAVLRTGYECLFFACAVWKDPAVVSQIDAQNAYELHKQAGKIAPLFSQDQLDAEVWAALKELESKPEGVGISVEQAAEKAGLKDIYDVVYRSLSKLGAHATGRSLRPYAPKQTDQGLVLVVGPKFDDADVVFKFACTCLRLGQERLRAQFSHLTYGPPIPTLSPESPDHPPS